MTLPLTLNSKLASQKLNLKPLLTLVIDGVATTFSSGLVKQYIRIGDDDLYIDNYNGDPWYIGGFRLVADQNDVMTFQEGTTTRITAQLQPDKGIGISVTQMTITLIDDNESISQLISPGMVVQELLGSDCKVQLGFEDTAFPADFTTIFRGMVEDIASGPGWVRLSLSSPEQKKRKVVFEPAIGSLNGVISDVGSIPTITLLSATGFLQPVNGPGGSPDSSVSYFVRIGDEFFSYTGISGVTLTGVTRNPSPFNFGQLSHAVGDEVRQCLRLQGNGVDLSRKLMLSGWNGFWKTGAKVSNFNIVEVPSTTVANAIFFSGIDVTDEYGLFAGDFITTVGAANGANNVALKEIIELGTNNDGSWIVVDGVSFVNELNSAATISFRSQWDTFPIGLKMKSNDVDQYEFNRLYRLFLSSFDLDFLLQNQIEGKSFIEEQIMAPMTCFSIFRNGRASMSYHIGPIPGAELLTLSQENIENASKLVMRRSLSKNYINTVIYNWDYGALSGKYDSSKKYEDAASLADFGIDTRSKTIQSQGMTSASQALAKSLQSSNRFLNRYKRAAEYLDNVEVRFGDGFSVDIGDIVILDTAGLSVTDIRSGSRSGTERFFQVLNKQLDIKTGKVQLSLTDTNFSTAARYCLISPTSKIKSGSNATAFVIESSFTSVYGANEYLKWKRFGEFICRVRSPDGTTRNGTALVNTVNTNSITLQASLGFTPQAGDLLEFSTYNDATDMQKLAYGFMRNTGPFDDGKDLYQQL